MKKIICFVCLLAIVLLLPLEAFASETALPFEIDYYSDLSADFSKEIEVADSAETIGVNSKVKTSKLIPMYLLNADSPEELLQIFEKIKNGEAFGNFLVPENKYFAVTYDGGGKAAGYCILSANGLAMLETGSLNADTDRSFDFNGEAFSELKENGLKTNSASAKCCTIIGFSVGTFFTDGEQEFFVPQIECYETAEYLTLNQVYKVSELEEILKAAGVTLPENEVDNEGNPYVGADEKISETQISAQEPETVKISPLPVVFAIFAIVCLAFAFKSLKKHKK